MKVNRKNARDVLKIMLLTTFAWGVLLVLPLGTFASSPVYATMTAVMSEFAWGTYAILAAGAGFYGLQADNPFWFAASGAMQAVLWAMVGLSLVLTNPITTGGPVYFGFSLIWLTIIRLKRQ